MFVKAKRVFVWMLALTMLFALVQPVSADGIQRGNSTYTLGKTDFTYAFDAPRRNGNYHQEVLNYINTNGFLDKEGIPTLPKSREEGTTTRYFDMQNVSGEIVIKCYSENAAANRTDITISVDLPVDDPKFYVKFKLLSYINGEQVASVEQSVEDYRSAFTMATQYIIEGDPGATLYLNMYLQEMIAIWDNELYFRLGFGMKCLGFTSYEGYGDLPSCNHSYSNTCDASCNTCGAVRPVEHTASNSCDTTCNVCGALLLANHSYSNGVCQVCQAKDPNYSPAIPGDVTGDSDVNNEDVILLLWHTLFPARYPLTTDGDMSKDGEINNEDVTMLLWYTLFPEDYPLK